MHRRRLLQSAPALLLAGCGRDSAIAGSIVGGSHARGHRVRDGGLPKITRKEKAEVVIVGGGIAGLAAARRLRKLGVEKIVVLELEPMAGGASCAGRNAVSAYPWGAHYVPLPGKECAEVLRFFEETGIITGHDAAGRPVYDELALCHDPHERLFIHGEWIEGLNPSAGLPKRELEQFAAFHSEIEHWRSKRGRDGKAAFVLPLDDSSQDAEILALDGLTMEKWMDEHGFDSEALRWHVDYCCRDDFGGRLDEVSAWAGLHYFASRTGEAANAERDTVLTWPQGNGRLVELLAEGLEELRVNAMAFGIDITNGVPVVKAMDARGEGFEIEARAVMLCVPRFVARRLLNPAQASPDLVYSPWVVANLTLDELPPSPGVLPAWDNVVFGGDSLGYVNATHQSLASVPQATVITHYEALCGQPPAKLREWMLTQTHAQWCERV
ncbi:MAG: FAD-dependent oxidoreductase, partial [Verrucomicrobiaceae bacterium]|nr:FAD-dependent oxidoreductase [Verrucomicrobiaceae bacterium]